MNMKEIKEKNELNACKDIICSSKGYTNFYPLTSFRNYTKPELYQIASNENVLLQKSKREIKAIFTEISKRILKTLNTPMKKIKIEEGPKYLEDGTLFDGEINFAESKYMLFTTYELNEYEKLQEEYDFDNYLYVLFHENKHAEQFYNFKHLDKNSNLYPINLFLRNEQIMRFFLSDKKFGNILPKNDYEFNSLERDADYFAIMTYSGAIKNQNIPADDKNLNFIIPKMLEYITGENNKDSTTLQLENYLKIFTRFKNTVSTKVYEKFAKDNDLENVINFEIFKESLEKRDQNVKDNLYEILSLYNDLAKNKGIKNFSKEEFRELCQKEKYLEIYNTLSGLQENELNDSNKYSEPENF